MVVKTQVDKDVDKLIDKHGIQEVVAALCRICDARGE